MTDWPKMYREHAARLREMADSEVNPSIRDQLLDLARQYDERTGAAGLGEDQASAPGA